MRNHRNINRVHKPQLLKRKESQSRESSQHCLLADQHKYLAAGLNGLTSGWVCLCLARGSLRKFGQESVLPERGLDLDRGMVQVRVLSHGNASLIASKG